MKTQTISFFLMKHQNTFVFSSKIFNSIFQKFYYFTLFYPLKTGKNFQSNSFKNNFHLITFFFSNKKLYITSNTKIFRFFLLFRKNFLSFSFFFLSKYSFLVNNHFDKNYLPNNPIVLQLFSSKNFKYFFCERNGKQSLLFSI